MPHYPAARLLVPPTPPALPEGFTELRSPVVKGLPHIIDLPNDVRLSITLPTGLLPHWLDADPAEIVASSAGETEPQSAALLDEIGSAGRPPLRLSARRGGRALGGMAFSLQAVRALRDDGDAADGAAIDVALLGWSLHVGTVRGQGDFGSFVTLAWRRADAAVEVFGPPIINPFLVPRLPLILRVQSQLGLRQKIIDKNFVARRMTPHGFA